MPYVKEQTDLPLLVVRARSVPARVRSQEGGKDDVFYFWDTKQQRAVSSAGLDGLGAKDHPAQRRRPRADRDLPGATGRWQRAEVTTVFELLKQEAGAIHARQSSRANTGLPAREIELFARELGTRKPAMIIHGAGTNHWFHNDLINRALILLVALTGNIGKNGGGFNHYVGQERVWPEQRLFQARLPRGTRKKQRFQNTTLWSYVHSTNKDPHLYNGKPIEWYIQESVKNGWMPLWPKKGDRKPRAFIVWRANYLNQAKGNENPESSLWKDLDLIVDINYRMDTTALYSDVVLPAASYYEKVDINTTDCHSYIHPFGKALDPLFESKTDWDIFRALAEKMARAGNRRKL